MAADTVKREITRDNEPSSGEAQPLWDMPAQKSQNTIKSLDPTTHPQEIE